MKTLIVALSLVLSLALFTGCGLSPIQKVVAAQKLYTTAATSLNENIKAGLITDKPTLQAIKTADNEAYAAIEEGKALAVAGKDIGFNLAWSRASKALDRFLLIYAQHEKRKEVSWTPSRSPRFFEPSSPLRTEWARLLQPPRPATS